MKAVAKDLLRKYMEQDSKDAMTVYDDEIRAEADLCAESCSCCRLCWVTCCTS